jgi:hypothetical protein
MYGSLNEHRKPRKLFIPCASLPQGVDNFYARKHMHVERKEKRKHWKCLCRKARKHRKLSAQGFLAAPQAP